MHSFNRMVPPIFSASYVYSGTSMAPTLHERDLLEVVPCDQETLQAGDVILFSLNTEDDVVVHRIVKITVQGICTCGDNNIHSDSDLVAHDHIIGKVAAVWRGPKRRKIIEGFSGILLVNLNRFLQRGCGQCAVWLRILYRFCSQYNFFSRRVSCRFKTRVVIFQSHNGAASLQLLLGSKIIGRYNPIRRQWSIRRPYRLLVNERELPDATEFE